MIKKYDSFKIGNITFTEDLKYCDWYYAQQIKVIKNCREHGLSFTDWYGFHYDTTIDWLYRQGASDYIKFNDRRYLTNNIKKAVRYSENHYRIDEVLFEIINSKQTTPNTVYSEWNYSDVYSAYDRPSPTKIAIWEHWLSWYNKNFPSLHEICVESKNCFFFTISALIALPNTGEIATIHITPTHNYLTIYN